MPYLIFDDDAEKTLHVVRNLDTAPPRAVIRLQEETGWKLTEIRDRIAGADFYAPLLTSFLTAATAGRPVLWDFLLDTPMSEWPWSFEGTAEEKAAAAREDAGTGDDAVDPPQLSLPDSGQGAAPQAEEWPPPTE